MSAPVLYRYFHPDYGPRLGVGLGDTLYDVSGVVKSIGAWLQMSAGQVPAAVDALVEVAQGARLSLPLSSLGQPDAPDLHTPYLLAPVDEQPVWAAGVTYERSRAARQEESADGGDVYARVYAAERPELFFKAQGRDVIGPGGEVGIRADAAWNVPEPELALVINPAMAIAGLTIGNDMSSRDLEGENPLYLPQAKVYTASCALGPGIVLGAVEAWPQTTLRLEITRRGEAVYSGEVSTERIHRSATELVEYLGRSNHYPEGVVLLTGTGIVPPGDFSLAAGDVVRITIDGIGALVNTVVVV